MAETSVARYVTSFTRSAEQSVVRTSVLLSVLAVVLLAGCLGSVGDAASGTGTPTDGTTRATQTSPDGTATATPYPNRSPAFPAGPKSEPDRPGELTADTVASFVKSYEFRYSYNDLWAGPGTEVGMSEQSCRVEAVEPRDPGYVVTVRCSAYVNEPVGGDDSTRTRHADYPPWTVRYYVDENSLLREEVE